MLTIGIDPDLHRSGYALWDNSLRDCRALYIWDLFKEIRRVTQGGSIEHIILIEDARLGNCSTWHGGGRGSARDVGKNMAISVILEDWCKQHDMNYRLIKPAGYSAYFENVDLFSRNTGWTGKTNKDARAAAAIVFTNH